MTQVHALVQGGLTIGRWMLPWIAVVFASAALAYAANGALSGYPSAGDHQRHGQITVAADEHTESTAVERAISAPAGQLTGALSFVTSEDCPPIGTGYGSYVDSSIVAAIRRIDCGQGAP